MFRFGNDRDHEETALTYYHGFSAAGKIAVAFAVLIVLRFLFGVSGVPYAPIVALVCTAVFVVLWIVLGLKSKRRKLVKEFELRKQRAELREAEFAQKLELAKMSGQPDAWEKKK